ncbi:Glycogen debranching enzyme [Frankliniella fusca]|uniref:Glycogen debranching enzyme n=1 Tax=Frankliniella fusca TaxID=407009 RepID=A0AAE1GS51_9NEOP|nr:Glycogen debranching enzyme [Frankliniella fusca]
MKRKLEKGHEMDLCVWLREPVRELVLDALLEPLLEPLLELRRLLEARLQTDGMDAELKSAALLGARWSTACGTLVVDAGCKATPNSVCFVVPPLSLLMAMPHESDKDREPPLSLLMATPHESDKDREPPLSLLMAMPHESDKDREPPLSLLMAMPHESDKDKDREVKLVCGITLYYLLTSTSGGAGPQMKAELRDSAVLVCDRDPPGDRQAPRRAALGVPRACPARSKGHGERKT